MGEQRELNAILLGVQIWTPTRGRMEVEGSANPPRSNSRFGSPPLAPAPIGAFAAPGKVLVLGRIEPPLVLRRLHRIAVQPANCTFGRTSLDAPWEHGQTLVP